MINFICYLHAPGSQSLPFGLDFNLRSHISTLRLRLDHTCLYDELKRYISIPSPIQHFNSYDTSIKSASKLCSVWDLAIPSGEAADCNQLNTFSQACEKNSGTHKERKVIR